MFTSEILQWSGQEQQISKVEVIILMEMTPHTKSFGKKNRLFLKIIFSFKKAATYKKQVTLSSLLIMW